MPSGIQNWSKTNASNATADSSINWAEGQAPSSVNDSARAMMARIAEWRDDLGGITTSGSSTAYAITSNRNFTTAALMDKAIITIVPHTTSGAAPTLAVDGLTARQIRSATGVNVPVGALIAGTPYVLIYINASTEFILLGGTAETNGIDALASTGLVARTALGTYAARALQSASAGLTWTNGDGVAGNPTPVLANDLAALEALSGTSTIYYRSGTDAWSAVTIGSSLSFSGGTLAAVFASQTDQETSTSTTAAVNPAVQQFHPSAAKFWANINGASSAALRVSYNITSLTDNGTGDNTLTIATDFSGADWVAASMGRSSGALGDAMMVYATAAAPTSGTVRINNLQKGSDTQLNSDINAVVGFGDQ